MANVNRNAPANGFVPFNENTLSQHLFIEQTKPNGWQKNPSLTGIANGEANGHVYPSYASLDSIDTQEEPRSKPKDVYDAVLPSWRAAIRTKLVRIVEWESNVLAKLQVCRTFICQALTLI
jgi:hypothetical protein